MGWCSAPNCTSSTKKGVRLFCFPRNKNRRSKWLINCLSEIQYTGNEFPNSHSLDQQILKCYVKLCLNIHVQELFRTYITFVQYASKTAARSSVK